MKRTTLKTINADLKQTWEHYTNGNVIVRCWSVSDPIALAIGGNGAETTNHYFGSFSELVEFASALLFGVEVEVGNGFSEVINQGFRDCEIISVKRSTFRIGYEMPNAGWMEGTRKVTTTYNGVKYYLPH